MKIECTQSNLHRGLSLVSRMVGTRTTLPVLANILLKTEKGRLRLSATDLEIGISTYLGGKVDKEGQITLPARLLYEFVSTNTDDVVNLELKGTDVILKSKHYTATIKGIEASEFPAIPDITPDFEAEVNTFDFRTAITQTVFAAALDETRPILSGVLIKINGDELKMAATDSFRLSEKTLRLNKKVEKKTEVVIPARTMVEMVRLLETGPENMRLRIGENQVAFTIGDVYMVSRILEGAFPDYEQIIPKDLPVKSSVQREELLGAMKMSALFARDSANNIKVNISSKEIVILAISPQMGENKAKVNAQTTGGEIDISFNARYILDALQAMTGKQTELYFAGKLSPCIIKDPADKSYLCIVMPLRVEN